MKKKSSKLTIIIIIVGALIVFSTLGTISLRGNFKSLFKEEQPSEQQGNSLKASNLRSGFITEDSWYYVSTSGYVVASSIPDKLIYALEGQAEKEIDLSKATVENITSGANKGKKKITPVGVKFIYGKLDEGSYRVNIIAVFGEERITAPAQNFVVAETYTAVNAINYETGVQTNGMTKESEWTKPYYLPNELPVVSISNGDDFHAVGYSGEWY